MTNSILFAVLGVLGPGVGTVMFLRGRLSMPLIIPAGVVVSAGLYAVGWTWGREWVWPLGILIMNAAAARSLWRDRAESGPEIQRYSGALAAASILVIGLGVLHHGDNVLSETGFTYARLGEVDTAFHAAVTWSLVSPPPIEVPGFPGRALHYHFGQFLPRAAAWRYFGVHPLDSLTLMDPALGVFALVLVLEGLGVAMGLSGSALWILRASPILTDFGSLYAAYLHSEWWADIFFSNILMAVFLANSVVPALAQAVGVVIVLGETWRSERRRLLCLAGFAAALPFFKVFVAASLLLGLAITAAGSRAARHRRDYVVAIIALALAIIAAASGPAGGLVRIAVEADFFPAYSRTRLDLPPLDSASGRILWLLVWSVLALGARVFGLVPAVRAFLSGRPEVRVLSVMALSGLPLGIAIRLAPPGSSGQVNFYHHYLIELSGVLLWVFAAGQLGTWLRGDWRRRAVVVVALLASLVGTAEFAWRKSTQNRNRLDSATVRIAERLAESAGPADLVLDWPEQWPDFLVLHGVRPVFTNYFPYLRQFVPVDEIDARARLARRFYRTTDAARASTILNVLKPTLVLSRAEHPLRFETAGLLVPVDRDGDIVLYRVATGLKETRR